MLCGSSIIQALGHLSRVLYAEKEGESVCGEGCQRLRYEKGKKGVQRISHALCVQKIDESECEEGKMRAIEECARDKESVGRYADRREERKDRMERRVRESGKVGGRRGGKEGEVERKERWKEGRRDGKRTFRPSE